MSMVGLGVPIDWTNGTGVIPAGGVISVPANPSRQGILVQNSATSAASITLTATRGDNGNATTATISLTAGAAYEFDITGFMTVGAFTVTGTVGAAITVLTF